MNKKLLISNDHYVRTTDAKHEAFCQALWEATLKQGDIYLDSYKGWYSVREEKFVTESEAKKTDYKDPVSGKPYTNVEEPSYFFRMSKYQSWLIEHIEKNESFVQPASRRAGLLKKLKSEPLRDLSLSRTTFDWGIPVPSSASENSEKHVMYVWYDALSNYISGLKDAAVEWVDGSPKLTGERTNTFWPHAHHIIVRSRWFLTNTFFNIVISPQPCNFPIFQ